MTTLTVWLLVVASRVYGGGYQASVTPFMFPTVEACEQVARNNGFWARCIQTTVVRP